MHVLFWIGSALIALFVAGAVWEIMASAAARRRFPPPGKMIDVGGRRLHLHCSGEGEGPTVVIEAGRFNTSVMWALVQEGISRFARVPGRLRLERP